MTVATRDWLPGVRASAWEAFREAVDPAPTTETWRRMPFGSWELGRLTERDAPALPGFAEEEAERARAAGAELLPLEEAAARYPELTRPYLSSARAGGDFAKLERANQALWRGGAFLRVPRGVRVEEPIRLSFAHGAAPFAFPRALVLAEEDSRVSVLEEHAGDGGGAPHSAAFSELVVGRGARVGYFYTQELPAGAVHFWHQGVTLGQDATLLHGSVLLGARRHKSELDVRLDGRGARSDIHGVLVGRRGQLFDPHTQQRHLASDTQSDLLFKTALRDDARSIYTGLIRIEREALDCEAYQANHNLLLSDDARADSTPILEILPDRVRCKHGATAGPLRADELFYLRSRGIPEAEATRMLIDGFFSAVLAHIPVEAVRERLAGKISRGTEP